MTSIILKKSILRLVIAYLFLAITSNAQAQATSVGPIVGGSILTDGSSNSSWSSLTNLTSSDGSAASTTALVLGGTSQEILMTGLGLSVPSTATIDGIVLDVRVKASGALGYIVRDNSVMLIVGGSVQGSDHASGSNWTGSFVNRTLGSSSDKWGVALTPAMVNDPDFGIAFSVQYVGLVLPTASIDYMAVTVHYTVPPLPVTINSFTASAKTGYNHLAWQTYSEINNDVFIVQKSLDGTAFHDIAIIKGAGSSNTVQNYSYDDNNLTFNKEYYRLIQKDVDGSVTIYSIISVSGSSELDASIVQLSSGENNLVISNCQGQSIEVVFSDLNGKILFNESVVATCNNYCISLNDKLPIYEPVVIRASYGGQAFAEHFVMSR